MTNHGWIIMRTRSAYLGAAAFGAIAVSGCGGGGGAGPVSPPATYNLQAGMSALLTQGQTTNVSLSGTAIAAGISTSFTGSGTFTLEAGVAATFDSTAAISQAKSISGTVTVAGQSTPFGVSATDYYASTNDAFLGETSSTEYDVAQSPFTYPTMVVGGSGGVLGTLLRYTDNTQSVPLGTTSISYTATAPVDPGSPESIAITDKVYDTQQNLTETDVYTYTLSAAEVLSFVSASSQTSSGTLQVTAN
jgi:hypothetical protein